jgi:hypothetical protein
VPKLLLPYAAPDISALARALHGSLSERHSRKADAPASHLEILGMLARAAGARNYQAWRAAAALRPAAETVSAPTQPPLSAHAARAEKLFDGQGRMVRWPVRARAIQMLCMWVLWTRFTKRRPYTEREVNDILRAAHTFEDHVTLRRELVNDGLLTRATDGSVYHRADVQPDEEVRALLKAIAGRH